MPPTLPVLDRQSVDIEFLHGINEDDAPERLDWSKWLKRADNLDTYSGYGECRRGLWTGSYLATDDQGVSAAPMRLLSTGDGLLAISGSGSDPFKVLHLNEAGGATSYLTRKNRASEFSLNAQNIGGANASGTVASPIVVGSAYTVLNGNIQYKVAAYSPNNGTDFHVSFTDYESGNIVRDYLLDYGPSSGASIAVISNTTVLVFIGKAAEAKVWAFSSTSLPAAVPSPTTLTSGRYVAGSAVIGTNAYVVFWNGNISKVNASGTETATGSVAGFDTDAIHDVATDGSSIYIVGLNSTPRGLMKVVNTSLTTTRTVTDTDATLSAARFTVGVDTSSNACLTAHYATVVGAFSMPTTRVITCSSGATVFTSVQAMCGWGMGTSPYYNPTVGEFYAVLVDQPNYDGTTVAQTVAGSSCLVCLTGPKSWLGKPTGFHIAAVMDRYLDTLAQNSAALGFGYNQHLFSADSGKTVTALAAQKLGPGSFNVEFRTLSLFDVTNIVCSSDVVSGGKGAVYDGLALSEFGSVGTPIVSAVNSGSGTGLPIGSYIYTAIWVYTDGRGRRHISRCAPSFTLTMASQKDATVTFTVPTVSDHVPLSYGQSVATNNYNFVYHIYRTVSGGTQFFRLASGACITSSATAVTLSVTDSTSDATLAARELLHRHPGTPGTPLDRYHAPASSCAVRHKDRVFVARGNDLFYSSFDVYGEAPWFNPAFQINVIGGTGNITALASVDGSLVVFKKNAIFVIDGDGPPENGGNGSEFSPPRRLSSQFGCVDARSLVQTPAGLMFMSHRGVELLTRNFQVEWIGNRVADTLNTYPFIGGSAFDPATGRAVWIMGSAAGTYPGQLSSSGDGVAIVYNVTVDSWTRYVLRSNAGYGKSFQDVVSAAVVFPGSEFNSGFPYGAKLLFADAAKLWFETPGVQMDYDGSSFYYVPMTLETGYVRAPSLQDRIRVDDINIIARASHPEDSDLTVSYAADYTPTYTSVKTWAGASLVALNPIMQLKAQPPKETVQSMSFKFATAGATTPGSYGSPRFFGITVRLGLKGGGAKLPSAQKG